jgi:hypothetical protein
VPIIPPGDAVEGEEDGGIVLLNIELSGVEVWAMEHTGSGTFDTENDSHKACVDLDRVIRGRMDDSRRGLTYAETLKARDSLDMLRGTDNCLYRNPKDLPSRLLG